LHREIGPDETMKRWFAGVITVDVTLLVVPTGWLGARIEFWVALTLASATGIVWCLLNAGRDDQ